MLRNHQRGERRASATADRIGEHPPPAPDDHAEAHAAGDAVRRALTHLSHLDREVLALVAWEELDVPAAARVMGCSTPTAHVRLHRARKTPAGRARTPRPDRGVMTYMPDADARLMTRLRKANPAPTGVFDERAEADLRAILTSHAAVVAPPRRRRPVLVAAAAAAAVLAAGATATAVLQQQDNANTDRGRPASAAADAPATGASSPPVRASAPGAQELLAAPGPQPAYDYQPAQTPSELASGADLVAVGDLVAAAPEGESLDCDGAAGLSAPVAGVVLRLDRLQVAKGPPERSTVLVVVPISGGQGLQTALPLGTRVLVYASVGTSAECQDVYRVRRPQGLAVQASGGQVVWPLLGQVRDGRLTRALPGGPLIAH